MISTYLSWIINCLEVLFPTQCKICRRPVRGVYICYRCKPEVPNLSALTERGCPRCFSFSTANPIGQECETCRSFPLLTDAIRFIWEYDGLARDMIRTIKYRPSMSLAKLAGQFLRDAAPKLFQETDWDIIIPIPSSRSTFRKRLFHPCVELAYPLAKDLKIPLIVGLNHGMIRAPQASLSHTERLSRFHNLFSLKRGFNPSEKKILLVEDVITTGATITAATNLLKIAGAMRVDVLALARTGVWSRFRKILYDAILLNRIDTD